MKISKSLHKFANSENGTVAILWAMALVVFFGMASLVFGIGRLGSTHGELQSFADNVALAAAGELDGRADAITRARLAAANLISDTQTFGTGNNVLSGVGDYTLLFHSDLPASDQAALGADITTDPALAAFAHVSATPHNLAMPFLTVTNALLGNGNGPIIASVSAEAVAGFTQEACDITPIMFCLPNVNYTAAGHIGDQVLMRAQGGSQQWAPGNWAFLDPSEADLGATCSGLNGATLLTCLVGAEKAITQCYNSRGVDTEPGQKVGLENAAFNVRFDIYERTMKNKKNDPLYPPAPNIINGDGTPGTADETIKLPRDSCFASGTCDHNNRFGDGNWDYAGYIDKNHGNENGLLDVDEDSHLTQFSIDNGAYAGTRYELYRQEVLYGETAGLPGNRITPVAKLETGRNSVSPFQSSDPNRRVVVAAGIDCASYQIQGRTLDVPVEEYFEIFLTESVEDPGNGGLEILGEIIGSAGGTGYSSAGNGGIFRDVVQLYR